MTGELRARVFAPRVTRRLERAAAAKVGQPADSLLPSPRECVPVLPSRAPLSWLSVLLRVKDDDLASEADPDALVFVRFHRLALQATVLGALFDVCVVLGWLLGRAKLTLHRPVLLPVHAQGKEGLTNLDRLTVGNVAMRSPVLWLHLISVCWKAACIIALCYRMSLWVERQQRCIVRARRLNVEGRTLLVTDMHLPGGEGDQAAAVGTLAHLLPFPLAGHTAVYDLQRFELLQKRRQVLLDLLDDAQMSLQSNLSAAGSGPSDASSDSMLAARPTHYSSHIGRLIGGGRVDSVDTYSGELRDVEAKLVAARAAMRESQSTPDAPLRVAATFLTFGCEREASIAARAMLDSDSTRWRIRVAPTPDDCLWRNIGRLSFRSHSIRSWIAGAIVWATVLFYTIPITAAGTIANVAALSKLLPWLKPIVELSLVKSILEGILPTLALKLFLLFLPAILRGLSAWQGAVSRSELDVDELRGFFLFSVFNVWLGLSLSAGVLNVLPQIIDNPLSIFGLLGTAIPGTAQTFISFIIISAATDAVGSLAGTIDYGLYLFRMYVLRMRRTPRLAARCWTPRGLPLGTCLSRSLLILLLGTSLTSAAPLVNFAVAVYFLLRLLSARFSVLFTHEPSYSGAGKVWAPLRNRVLFALLAQQATMAGLLALKQSAATATIIVGTVMPCTYFIMRAMVARFDSCAPPGEASPPLSWLVADDDDAAKPAAKPEDASSAALESSVALDTPLLSRSTFVVEAYLPPFDEAGAEESAPV